MSLLARLLALFVVVPLVELVLLIRIGQWLGVLATVALVVVTGVIGAALARREGLRTVRQIQADMKGGRFPAGRLLDGVMILLAGGLLLTPGHSDRHHRLRVHGSRLAWLDQEAGSLPASVTWSKPAAPT
jgi:UPF0716 family protein affecting phage T7 exclusion